jgi:hypothetical protein
MNALKHWRAYLLVCCLILSLQPLVGNAQQNSDTSKSSSTVRDGQHDFDFYIGAWKTHIRRLVHPLSGSTNWADYDGTTVVRKVWDGRANLSELEADGAAGHLENLSLRLYNPQAHQWSLNYANSREGTMDVPT